MTICAAPDCQHGHLAHAHKHGVGSVGRCLAPGCCCQVFEGANRQAGKAKVGEMWENEGTNQDGPGGSLRQQQAGFPGPRPTPLGAPN